MGRLKGILFVSNTIIGVYELAPEKSLNFRRSSTQLIHLYNCVLNTICFLGIGPQDSSEVITT